MLKTLLTYTASSSLVNSVKGCIRFLSFQMFLKAVQQEDISRSVPYSKEINVPYDSSLQWLTLLYTLPIPPPFLHLGKVVLIITVALLFSLNQQVSVGNKIIYQGRLSSHRFGHIIKQNLDYQKNDQKHINGDITGVFRLEEHICFFLLFLSPAVQDITGDMTIFREVVCGLSHL